jgi:hypothetical protein
MSEWCGDFDLGADPYMAAPPGVFGKYCGIVRRDVAKRNLPLRAPIITDRRAETVSRLPLALTDRSSA